MTKYSEPRITEISNESDKEEPKDEKEALGKEHCPERATNTEHDHKKPAADKSLPYIDNKDIPEGIEVMEDKKQHQPSTSNIRKALQTVASVLWPRSTKGHFLDQAKSKARDP